MARPVFSYAVRKMSEASGSTERNGITVTTISAPLSRIRPTDASSPPPQNASDFPLDRIIINIDRYGNTTAGTIPLAMQTAREEGRLKKNDLVLVASVGAGFTVGASLLRWEI